jgi:IS30 family transposase
MSKNKHFSFAERQQIERLLSQGLTFKEISMILNKSASTISREVRKHLIIKKTGAYGRKFNDCLNRVKCDEHYLCQDEGCKKNSCKFCSKCIEVCSIYVQQKCQRLLKSPYVCNGCNEKPKCTLEKAFYNSQEAQKGYKRLISESRTGVNITESEIIRLNEFIKPLIDNGHSIHHICANNRDTIMISEKTIYNYIDDNILEVKNIDLPRKVRFKLRKKPKSNFKVDRACRNNRTYNDFLKFIEKHPDLPIVEMDSVLGRKGGKLLLTIHFRESLFMLAFIRDYNTSQSVIDIFNDLYRLLTPTVFRALFPVILTDNGSEFSNPTAIEFDENGERRTNIFFCDPYASYQKGACEVNHEFIRRIIPKGTSMDHFDQNDITLMMDHINSYGRKKLNNQSPFELFSFFHKKSLLTKLGATPINKNEIVLKPRLLKK